MYRTHLSGAASAEDTPGTSSARADSVGQRESLIDLMTWTWTCGRSTRKGRDAAYRSHRARSRVSSAPRARSEPSRTWTDTRPSVARRASPRRTCPRAARRCPAASTSSVCRRALSRRVVVRRKGSGRGVMSGRTDGTERKTITRDGADAEKEPSTRVGTRAPGRALPTYIRSASARASARTSRSLAPRSSYTRTSHSRTSLSARVVMSSIPPGPAPTRWTNPDDDDDDDDDGGARVDARAPPPARGRRRRGVGEWKKRRGGGATDADAMTTSERDALCGRRRVVRFPSAGLVVVDGVIEARF